MEATTGPRVLATPADVCKCGHLKIFHAWLNQHHEPGEEIVLFERCSECACANYTQGQPQHDKGSGDGAGHSSGIDDRSADLRQGDRMTRAVIEATPAILEAMVDEYERTGASTCPACQDRSQPWAGMFVCPSCDWAANIACVEVRR